MLSEILLPTFCEPYLQNLKSLTQFPSSKIEVIILYWLYFFFKNYCSITVVPIFLPLLSSALLTPTSHIQSSSLPLSLSMGPLYMFHDDPSSTFLIISLWLLSVCSLFPCFWFYFARLFVLLIRFQLKVRSYGMCLSQPGLFHLA